MLVTSALSGPSSDQGSIWRSTHFRAAIREKIEAAFSKETNPSGLNSAAIEEQLFAKARTKDEYLELSARVIVHFKHHKKEISDKVVKSKFSATKRRSGEISRGRSSSEPPKKKIKAE